MRETLEMLAGLLRAEQVERVDNRVVKEIRSSGSAQIAHALGEVLGTVLPRLER